MKKDSKNSTVIGKHSIVELTTGQIYFGVLGGSSLDDACRVDSRPLSKEFFAAYLKQRNTGELVSLTLSPAVGSVQNSLNQEEKADFEFVSHQFERAVAMAAAFSENLCFDALRGSWSKK